MTQVRITRETADRLVLRASPTRWREGLAVLGLGVVLAAVGLAVRLPMPGLRDALLVVGFGAAIVGLFLVTDVELFVFDRRTETVTSQRGLLNILPTASTYSLVSGGPVQVTQRPMEGKRPGPPGWKLLVPVYTKVSGQRASARILLAHDDDSDALRGLAARVAAWLGCPVVET